MKDFPIKVQYMTSEIMKLCQVCNIWPIDPHYKLLLLPLVAENDLSIAAFLYGLGTTSNNMYLLPIKSNFQM